MPEPDANPGLIREARFSSAWVGMPALTSQADFISTFRPLREGELEAAASRVVYLHAHNEDLDPLVKVDASIIDWKRAFPHMKVEEIATRAGNWHIPLIERPAEVMQAILAA